MKALFILLSLIGVSPIQAAGPVYSMEYVSGETCICQSERPPISMFSTVTRPNPAIFWCGIERNGLISMTAVPIEGEYLDGAEGDLMANILCSHVAAFLEQ